MTLMMNLKNTTNNDFIFIYWEDEWNNESK